MQSISDESRVIPGPKPMTGVLIRLVTIPTLTSQCRKLGDSSAEKCMILIPVPLILLSKSFIHSELMCRKALTNLDSIFKRRDITLPIKVLLVKAMAFLVIMYGCESWTIKKAACRRIDAFELWCWRRLLRVPWTAKRSNQSILKEISPGCSLEGLMLKLKLQYFGHLM